MLRKAFAIAALGCALIAGPALASGGSQLPPKEMHWSNEGPLGKFDQAQLQRGYKVYREVCSSCHAMNLMYFRNLGQPGGPFYDPKYKNPNENPYVKAIAAEYQVNDVDSETGDTVQRPGTSADRFPAPFPNEPAARASNGGALPPDLSVITKARHGGAGYVYSLLMGFDPPPQGLTVAPGQHYNRFFAGDTAAAWAGDPRHKPPGGFLAMAPPLLRDGQVTFDDGTPATREQMARDVATFLAWAGDPKMQNRKQMGVSVIAYLIILAVLAYISYRRIWRNVEH
jgi:ubiquinol-cytochrome c reductase cytochrome c1 subunit